MIEKFEQFKVTALYFYGQARTALTALTGLVALLLGTGLLSGPAQHYAQIIIGLATVLGVYRVKDDAPAGKE